LPKENITGRVENTGSDRRPIDSRSTGWAKWLASRVAVTAITPDHISLFSIFWAALGAGLIIWGGPAAWILAAIAVQLRLLCNPIDGMVAVEGGKATPRGVIYNEFPDRIADCLVIVSLGYAAGVPWLGWVGALIAVSTAYIRVFGGSLGLSQDFGGIMAKPKRMAAITLGLIAQAVEIEMLGSRYSLLAVAVIIAIGGLVTCVTRTIRIARQLDAA
jgi:phosphatidylglycerophosphate synthase